MRNQRGTVIFTALFMVAIISSISVALITFQRLDIMRARQIVTTEQAQQYSYGAIYWAISVLKNPALVATAEPTKWPKTIPATLLQGAQGAITAELDYYNNRFNLNELVKAQKITELAKIIQNAGLDFPKDWANEVGQQIMAWINTQESKYDENYLSHDPPYRMAHMPMVSVSELRLIEGVSAEQYEMISPLLSAFTVNSPEKFLLHTTVQISDQQLQMYALLQRSISQGKVEVQTLWQVFNTF